LQRELFEVDAVVAKDILEFLVEFDIRLEEFND
jgi:hypothetical protein